MLTVHAKACPGQPPCNHLPKPCRPPQKGERAREALGIVQKITLESLSHSHCIKFAEIIALVHDASGRLSQDDDRVRILGL